MGYSYTYATDRQVSFIQKICQKLGLEDVTQPKPSAYLYADAHEFLEKWASLFYLFQYLISKYRLENYVSDCRYKSKIYRGIDNIMSGPILDFIMEYSKKYNVHLPNPKVDYDTSYGDTPNEVYNEILENAEAVFNAILNDAGSSFNIKDGKKVKTAKGKAKTNANNAKKRADKADAISKYADLMSKSSIFKAYINSFNSISGRNYSTTLGGLKSLINDVCYFNILAYGTSGSDMQKNVYLFMSQTIKFFLGDKADTSKFDNNAGITPLINSRMNIKNLVCAEGSYSTFYDEWYDKALKGFTYEKYLDTFEIDDDIMGHFAKNNKDLFNGIALASNKDMYDFIRFIYQEINSISNNNCLISYRFCIYAVLMKYYDIYIKRDKNAKVLDIPKYRGNIGAEALNNCIASRRVKLRREAIAKTLFSKGDDE